jgi:hypothetical protein
MYPLLVPFTNLAQAAMIRRMRSTMVGRTLTSLRNSIPAFSSAARIASRSGRAGCRDALLVICDDAIGTTARPARSACEIWRSARGAQLGG